MTQTLKLSHISGIATTSTKVSDGLGALHLRVQVEEDEKRFMISARDFSRLVCGRKVHGYDRDDFNEQDHPITAMKIGDMAVFEVYGTHRYETSFADLQDLWSFRKTSLLLSGSSWMPRTETLIKIAIRAMDRLSPADLFPCKKVGV